VAVDIGAGMKRVMGAIGVEATAVGMVGEAEMAAVAVNSTINS